nr:family 78 glycoside hydrolase catalytic domain [uncultured Sphaerochaeta sp.]
MSEIQSLKANYLDRIAGITESPRFSWTIGSSFRHCRQKQYQLQIGRDESFGDLLFDSGLVDSNQSAYVRADGFVPEEGMLCYARVRAVTEADEEGQVTTGFSRSVPMLGGLKEPGELKAHFITAEGEEDIEKSRGTYLRREFSVGKPIRSARIFSTAQGLYRLFLNGRKVSEDELAPGWTSYDRRLLYQSYDVTEYVREGVNAVGAHLGAGWYKGTISFLHIHNFYGDYASLSLRMDLTYEDGTRETLYTDESWKGTYSPVVHAQIYDGETYDASLEQDGWNHPGLDDSSWRHARSCPCTSERIEAQQGSPVCLNDYVAPRLAFFTPKGERVIDFGQNMSALPEIRGQGKAGDKIVLRCFEVLDRDGNVYRENLRKAAQTITYRVRDSEPFCYRPGFSFFGFRFIYVESFCGRADLDNFAAYAVHSDMETTGSFECSHPGINRLQENIRWGMKSNFVDVPTDCPQRDERLGWTGDAQIFSRTADFNANTYNFFSKWLRDLALDQTEEGGVPHVVPDVLAKYSFDDWLLNRGTHSAAAWGDAAVIIPWDLYLTYGDRAILETQFDSMKGWIDFMRSHAEGNIWNYRLQFGDWVALDAEEGSYFGATPNELTCTAYFAHSTELFIKAARVLGRERLAEEYEGYHREIVRTFRETFFDNQGNMTARTQTAHILALHFHLAPEEYIPRTIEALKTLLAEHKGCLVTGFVGTPYFCHALSSHGCLKEAYDLLLKEDFPSWLYQVKKGATTIWEHWDGIKPDGSMWSPDMNSFNHYAYGAIGEWLYRVAAGIEIDEKAPGYARTIVAPRIGGDLEYVESSYRSVYGRVAVRWDIEGAAEKGGKIVRLRVSIPANTTALIRLMDNASVLEGDGLTFTDHEGNPEAEAGSGSYTVRYELS